MQMKFKAHQSFFIRKGWLSKGLRAVTAQKGASLLMPSNSKEAMDELGLGSNQVVALRYWMQTLGLVQYVDGRKRAHELTELGNIILENDPYTEEVGTLFALHCNLASAQEDAAAWYYFFNEFKMSAFIRDDFTRGLTKFVFDHNDKKEIALTSLEADFNCILSTYIPHDRTSRKPVSPENVIDCPFGDLGLVDIEDRGRKSYRKTPANLTMLPALLVLYCICLMQERFDGASGAEIRLETLVDGPCSPGCLFNLDSVSLLSKLYELENEGLLRIVRTAGLDVIRLTQPDMSKEECLSRYYELIG